MCDEWNSSFASFLNWAITHGYEKGLQLDRINNDEGYSPDNCRWVTRKENQNNRAVNHVIEYNGEKHTVAEWSRITGISRKALDYRIKAGKSPGEILAK